MRKKIIVGLIVFVTASVAAVCLLFNPIIARGVETGGSMMTQAEVRLEESDFSLDGTGEMKGLSVGNPEGFSSPESFRMKHIRVSLEPKSVLDDRVIIREIIIDGSDIIFEFDGTSNNIGKIMDNVEAFAEKHPEWKRKVQIDNFIMKNVRVSLASDLFKGEKGIPVPDIRLKDIGAGKDGATAAEAITQILVKMKGVLGQTWAGSKRKVKSAVKKTVNKLKGLKKFFQ